MAAYARLAKLIDQPIDLSAVTIKDLEPSIHAVGQALVKGRGVGAGRAGISIYEGNRASHYCLDLMGTECKVSNQPAEDARFSISVAKETWAEIASGTLAPMEAFLTGRMAVSGDIDFARRLYAKLATKRGRTDF